VFPRVVWLVPDERQVGQIRDTIGYASGVDAQVHAAMTLD
jgi:hypothetical protein